MIKQSKKLKNILIPSPKKLAKLIAGFAREGAAKIHVLADFDNTLTKTFVNGKKIPSLISVLRDKKFLTPDYPAKAYALYDKYRPLEDDPKITPAKKKEAMRRWYEEHFKLLIESGLRKRDVVRAVQFENVQLRSGSLNFYKLLHDHNIPLIIMSASGLGQESIYLFLKKRIKIYGNIHIISNSIIWNKNGLAVAVNKPIIHAANKDETELKNFPAVMEKIKNKKNVILLGDKLEDLHMITGFNYGNIIKIGFLNENIKTNLRLFKKNFDIIILDDGPLDYINQTLKKIIHPVK